MTSCKNEHVVGTLTRVKFAAHQPAWASADAPQLLSAGGVCATEECSADDAAAGRGVSLVKIDSQVFKCSYAVRQTDPVTGREKLYARKGTYVFEGRYLQRCDVPAAGGSNSGSSFQVVGARRVFKVTRVSRRSIPIQGRATRTGVVTFAPGALDTLPIS